MIECPTVLKVTVGAFTTVATGTALPLLMPFVVTTAVRLPVVLGNVERVTVNSVLVADVTVPTALRLKTTALFAAVVSNPVPVMVTEVARIEIFVVLVLVTVGAA